MISVYLRIVLCGGIIIFLFAEAWRIRYGFRSNREMAIVFAIECIAVVTVIVSLVLLVSQKFL